jgi:hypothetical protein
VLQSARFALRQKILDGWALQASGVFTFFSTVSGWALGKLLSDSLELSQAGLAPVLRAEKNRLYTVRELSGDFVPSVFRLRRRGLNC